MDDNRDLRGGDSSALNSNVCDKVPVILIILEKSTGSVFDNILGNCRCNSGDADIIDCLNRHSIKFG